jgi:membrane protein YdbS with pleckstrin-like domain
VRTLCSSTLIGEFFVIGFAGLVAMKHPDLSMATVWGVCGAAMVVCVLLCAVVTRPGALAVGWALQIGLIASGFVVGTMFVLGVIFAALWWASIHFGRKVDEIKARHAAQAA